jgi:hypothetical protein
MRTLFEVKPLDGIRLVHGLKPVKILEFIEMHEL